ncbi:MAG: hypothetical protein IPH18_06025 [Chitinophagaceae bacterium]|nr:hypothetical protein [Chitinophagaceae bacterium]
MPSAVIYLQRKIFYIRGTGYAEPVIQSVIVRSKPDGIYTAYTLFNSYLITGCATLVTYGYSIITNGIAIKTASLLPSCHWYCKPKPVAFGFSTICCPGQISLSAPRFIREYC